ncbi:valine--tRNA ligase [Candidatus Woesearchaeota archaeon]|nr:valine--tRNA ligase [Candidatus Woesearchaeota archaeon]
MLEQNYDAQKVEAKWQKYWEEQGIYKFDQNSKNPIYSVDTPPPTVSGKMHIGHAFSFSQQDFIVRYKRMCGFNIFCPFGTDDNGLATERLVEKLKKVRARDMDRKEFAKLCLDTLQNELRPSYIADWKRIGMSCDWNIYYTTIDEHCQRISQREFINLYKMGRAYRKDAPSMWCPECNTGISQVECVDKEIASSFNDIVFKVKAGKSESSKDGSKSKEQEKELIIATTRPELLPACVAVFYHPSDARYWELKGKKAKVPLFDFEVPILEDERADPEKGTGIVMCCTFGDQTDMEWQKAHNLPIKQAISSSGKLTEIAGKYAGEDIKSARKRIIEDMKAKGLLKSQIPIKHAVNVHERCGTEVEFIKAKQWFIRYLDLKDDMLKWGNQLKWHPAYMKNRYDNWVKGLQWDWLISRQRYFGVPFPVWYCANCEEVILADEKNLPVDPLKEKPPINKCPKCGGTKFVAEKDVLDTWATSSLTPRLAVELMPKELWPKLFPMSLRPQAHDIITFWLFNTTFRSNIHYGTNPWSDCMISGWALDPVGKKMSKSKGNVVEPQAMIKQYCADALRFWAASSSLGEDVPFQEKELVSGKKTLTKMWNAAKFCYQHLADYEHDKSDLAFSEMELMDRWLLIEFNKAAKNATEFFNDYNFSEAKKVAEQVFWRVLCDNYLEIAKSRLYDTANQAARRSAQHALYHTFLGILKLFAPIMPYMAEELYQAYYANNGRNGVKSIHLSNWPEYDKKIQDDAAEKLGSLAINIISQARKHKTSKQMSLKQELARVVVELPFDISQFKEAELKAWKADLMSTIVAKELELKKGNELKVSVL